MIWRISLLISAGILLIFISERTGCSARWGDRSSWSFLAGCMVDGVPEKNIRIEIEGN